MAVLPKVIYRVSIILTRIPDLFLTEIDRLILKVIQKFKWPRLAKTILKKNEVGGLMLPNFKTYCRVKVFRTVWYWGKTQIME